ncbi:hypothetical protein OAD62_01770 [Oceanihabitans sp.]|nr:hypothetical protein [Oceanihabitans sp.]
MKKLLLGITLVVSLQSFAQTDKEALKTEAHNSDSNMKAVTNTVIPISVQEQFL